MAVSPSSSPPERDRLESRIAVRLHAHDFVELCEVARAHDRSAAAGCAGPSARTSPASAASPMRCTGRCHEATAARDLREGPGKDGHPCRRAAGAGTPFQTGRCSLHGGRLKKKLEARARDALVAEARFLGDPLVIAPGEALLACVELAAGELAYWRNRAARSRTATSSATTR